MNLLDHALHAGQHRPASLPLPPLLALQSLLVVGGGGTLGSAVLAEALVAGRFARVLALVAQPLTSALRGLHPVPQPMLAVPGAWRADAAVIVFERQRHSNGRDAAFVQPAPAELLPLARALRQQGVRRLIVVVPHAPALLPQALRHGLASLDEGAVAALDFQHLVFVRAAQHAQAAAGGPRLQRFAHWWLSQLRLMIPQQEQPVRAVVLARCIVQLARQLPATAPGTRVLSPDQLGLAAQGQAGPDADVPAWLGSETRRP